MKKSYSVARSGRTVPTGPMLELPPIITVMPNSNVSSSPGEMVVVGIVKVVTIAFNVPGPKNEAVCQIIELYIFKNTAKESTDGLGE